ncbi:hypothetical protein BA895_20745 [Humibacillus sp. DSM 29435]|uniref:hypothetical protein n=1 Tax=Humibacillus sp. DSM 29435 TaxID=1869167 RepID=UPI0008730A7F|nr:hypothetical protein [Humibacillus sp. DSM 29435]OFE16045.1 hypothetical protein BA895_20745 [Humibacillus sp. DSM 29435]
MSSIDFGDEHALADFATFVGRARQVRADGAVRLQVMGGLLLSTVAVLDGSGLMGEGAVLGLRVVPVAATDDLDATVSFASIGDRLARGGSAVLPVPPVTVSVPWAGLAPPRGGWEPVGSLPCSDVDDIARQGISAVAEGSPATAGGLAVEALRRRVWGAMSDTRPPIVAGLALGAHVLGFTVAGSAASVSANGRWTRLSTSQGHVLVR